MLQPEDQRGKNKEISQRDLFSPDVVDSFYMHIWKKKTTHSVRRSCGNSNKDTLTGDWTLENCCTNQDTADAFNIIIIIIVIVPVGSFWR